LQLEEKVANARSFIRGALTPGEERVVELLVREGLSDAGLGARLNLSSRTVEQHLRAVYAKAANHWDLEQVTRTQLVALLNLFYNTQITGKPA
jgi:DNA-binding NarL/FixJ family response regulator